jgi:hypothetical protein
MGFAGDRCVGGLVMSDVRLVPVLRCSLETAGRSL